MLILPYTKKVNLIKGMSVSIMEIDVISKNVNGYYTATYAGIVTSMNTNKYTYTNNTPLNQKVFKGVKNLYIA